MASLTTGLQTSGSDFIGLNNAMKIIYSEPLTDNIVADSELLDIFEQDMRVPTEETDGGQYIQLAHYYAMAGSVGSRLENDYIPEAAPPSFANSQIYLKKIMGTTQMSGEAYRRAKLGPGAFINWAEQALPETVRRFTDDLDRQLMGWGQGILAQVADASPSGTTLNLVNAFGISGLTQATPLFPNNVNLRAGPNSNASSLRSGVMNVTGSANITSTGAAGQIYVNALATSIAQYDYLFPGDSQATSGFDGGTVSKEIMGLLGMVDNGTVLSTFQGLARANNNFWNSQVINSSTGSYSNNLSEDILTDLDFNIIQYGNGRPDALVCSRGAWKSFWKTLRGDRFFPMTSGEAPNYKGGGRQMSINLGDRDIPLRVCRKCPPQVAFLIERESFKRWHNTGLTWDDTTGSIWNRVTDTNGRKDAYYALCYLTMATGNLAPAHNGLITNLVSG